MPFRTLKDLVAPRPKAVSVLDGPSCCVSAFPHFIVLIEKPFDRMDGQEIFVTHYNPLKPRTSVQDEFSKLVGGHVDAFRAGDVHRMALESPVDDYWMGGIIDKYQDRKGVRYWAVWTNSD